MAGDSRPRVRHGRGAVRVGGPVSIDGNARGRTTAAVNDLAAQRAAQVPYPEAAVPGAVRDRVSGQLMHGQDHLADPVLGQPSLADVGLHSRP